MHSAEYKAQFIQLLNAVFPDGIPEGINCLEISCNGHDFDFRFEPTDIKKQEEPPIRVNTSSSRNIYKRPRTAKKINQAAKLFEELINDNDLKLLGSLRISLNEAKQK